MNHSILLMFQHAQDFSDLTYNAYHNPDVVRDFFFVIVEAFKECVATWEGFEQYVSNIEDHLAHLVENGKISHSANKSGQGYNVLNHGDFHSRNILFKLNGEKRLQNFYFVSQMQSC